MGLIVDDKILKAATDRGIPCFQVSEGHRINVGSIHLEVLYPWDGFYDSLLEPRALRKLLSKRWPEDWLPGDRLEPVRGERREKPAARQVTRDEAQREALEKLLSEMELPESESESSVIDHPLADGENRDIEIETETDEFPVSLLGTLYNNLSVVVRVFVTGGTTPCRLLFPGDLTDWTYLVGRRWFDLEAEIFKYPHHGSSGPGVRRGAVYWPERRFPWCYLWLTFQDKKKLVFLREYMCSQQGQSSQLFCELVNPSHTLIFPYPGKGLPKQDVLKPCLGMIHANRQHQNLNQLAQRNNPAALRLLRIDKERNEIQAI